MRRRRAGAGPSRPSAGSGDQGRRREADGWQTAVAGAWLRADAAAGVGERDAAGEDWRHGGGPGGRGRPNGGAARRSTGRCGHPIPQFQAESAVFVTVAGKLLRLPKPKVAAAVCGFITGKSREGEKCDQVQAQLDELIGPTRGDCVVGPASVSLVLDHLQLSLKWAWLFYGHPSSRAHFFFASPSSLAHAHRYLCCL
jgi:hypothetical protein